MKPHAGTLYDDAFYAAQAAGSARSARVALSYLYQWVQPHSAVDIGCGIGTWLQAARALGTERIVGFDGPHVARENLVIAPAQFTAADLGRDSPAELLPPGERWFDCVLSLEVAEHLPHARSRAFIGELTRLGDLVLFSAALPFQNGTGHINEQWPEFWAILFNAAGFSCFDPLRPLLRGRPEVEWWYAQNILVFARRGSAACAALPVESCADGEPLSLVHPVNLLVQTLWNARPHREAARGLEEADQASLTAAWCAGATEPPALRTVADPHFPQARTVSGDPERALREAHAALALAEGALREATYRIEALQRRCELAEQRPRGAAARQ